MKEKRLSQSATANVFSCDGGGKVEKEEEEKERESVRGR